MANRLRCKKCGGRLVYEELYQLTNSEIDKVINEKVQGEIDRKIAHDWIIDGMTYLQILHKYFPQCDDYSDKAKQRAIRFRIKPIIEKVTKENARR